MATKQRRYLGVQPFKTSDSNIFFGRDEDIENQQRAAVALVAHHRLGRRIGRLPVLDLGDRRADGSRRLPVVNDQGHHESDADDPGHPELLRNP